MSGGTLVVSRHITLHDHYKKRLMSLGFRDVTVTEAEKDGLNMVINEIKPRLLIIGAGFYKCATPFMVGQLLRRFPKLNIAAVTYSEYPPDYMMGFLKYGAKSVIYYLEGRDQFYKGLEWIRNGKHFVSESIKERLDLRDEMPEPVADLTTQQVEIIRLVCNGMTGVEIANILHISHRTVQNQRTIIYTILHVRNENELIRIAINLGIVNPDDLCFYADNYETKPLPVKNIKKNTTFGKNIFLVKPAPNAIGKKEAV